ncbi:MAG: isoleucine--tRNA ligase [Humidesulfovibrio sp.]|uniref:isoleucine--tRNA ligase n=1 Tax=Humidesulfovibrio sp. TaxID=2910988 RepID=UPI0027F1E642|nr:isoleucine--tRNA ligase [Humidesulfovibrio sp.]MDQ7834048.1 isoleucine--tRNA ligase [Humidesulfovibrio sp.]
MSDYKSTLRLPQTGFPMKANLKQKEPETLKFWAEIDAYSRMVSANEGSQAYVLHDGPPYANGNIHMGTAMNKVLKDIVVKSRNMSGQKAEYVPGWDCHGLPIEHKVETELKKKKKELPAVVIRKLCREYALKFLDIQRSEFKRLGVLGTWDKPYMTLDPKYEAATARELGNFMDKGSVIRGKKPIYWCCSCHTALAEAEVEYADHSSPSVFVRFPLTDKRVKDLLPQGAKYDAAKTFVVIWTTTPWTLPDNMGVCVHPEFDYVFAEVQGNTYLMAARLLAPCAEIFGWDTPKILATVPGLKLEGLEAQHPIYKRKSPIILGDHVTLDAGTGCVHTAPGHGREDYDVGLKYGLEVYSPLDDAGRFLTDVEFFAGLNVFEANPKVIEKLKQVGNLIVQEKITHSYPHCWRCKEPVIFRATTQWFISMEANDLRKNALSAIHNDVRWIPAWGEERIANMIENRPDWCISRQRNWGVPIVALICVDCDEAYFETPWVMSVVDRFATHPTGCDYWFEAPLEDIVPAGLACPKCGRNHWRRETDILDVWFDSGTSFAAVLEQRPELSCPADLYLEGSDQHRGWFHSSLLASVGTRGVPPYKAVLTHGYVVDGEGRKMSKSIGNVIAPQQIIDKYGAEILRMWVSAVNYQEDIRISDEILNRLVDAYRRIRNTCRFILGNLADFNPKTDALPVEKMLPLDRFALDLVERRHNTIAQAYEDFEFHKVYHTLHNLCTTDLSAFYLDIIKDRLYVCAGDDRRSAQTVLWRALLVLLHDMAPVLSFTAEEAYGYLSPESRPGTESVFSMRLPEGPALMADRDRQAFELLLAIRGEVTKAIEPKRKAGDVGHSLDTHVTLHVSGDAAEALATPGLDLCEFLIVSRVSLDESGKVPADAFVSEEVKGLAVSVAKAPGEKCQRCWRYEENLGSAEDHPEICPRCTAVVQGL